MIDFQPFRIRKSRQISFCLIAFGLVFFADKGVAQPILTLKQALEIALQNNFEVRIARNDAVFAKESNTYGNAGFLPNVGLTGNRTFQSTNLRQEFSSGLVVEKNAVNSTNTVAGLGINWVLFDGGKMFITKRKQDVLEDAGNIRLQSQIQGLVDSLSANYYQVVMAGLDLEIAKQDIGRTEERLKISRGQFEIGTRSKSDWLTAQIDLNVLKTRQLNLNSLIETRKGSLNQLMGRDPSEAFSVEGEVVLAPKSDYQSLKEKLKSENAQLKFQERQFQVAKLSIDELKTRRLPQITLNSGYNFSQNRNEAGFSLFSQNLGPSIGLGFSLPIYNGNSVKQLLKLADLDLESKSLQLKSLENRLTNQLWRAVQNHDFQLNTISLEEENVRLATENLGIAKGRFQLAQSTSLELKDAEFQLSNAQTRLNQARFNAKSAENQILRLQGGNVGY